MSDPHKTAYAVRRHIQQNAPGLLPARVGLILGSGLGLFADRLVTDGGDFCAIPFSDIPGLPEPTVGGHRGRLICGRLGEDGPPVLCLDGRLHIYEGHSPQTVALPARIMSLLGAKVLVVTNAAGGINAGFSPGDLMLIEDHMNLSGHSPLRGPNDDSLGPRFPDMSEAYDKDLRELALSIARERSLELKRGVYSVLSGPAYETPAEIRALRTLGADAVGMSTVFEVTAAVHCGVRCLGFSLITNVAAGLSESRLSHEEVLQTANEARDRLLDYLDHLVPALCTAAAADAPEDAASEGPVDSEDDG